MGDRIGHVTDVGGQDRRERAYRNSRELTLHTDRCDVIGMACLEPAMRGGVSGYASAHTVYNEILATRPDLLEPLFAGFRYHRRGEELPGEPPITAAPVPVLSEWEGELSVVFLRAYIEMAAKDLGQPLTERELAALDAFEEVSRRADVKLEFTLGRGEAIFFNNCTMLHNRTRSRTAPIPRGSGTCSGSGSCWTAAGPSPPPCTRTRARRASPAATSPRPTTREPRCPSATDYEPGRFAN